MLDKVNIANIIRNHFATLKDNSTNRPRFWDYLLFLVVPFALSGVLLFFYGRLQSNLVNVLATSLSIFTALLFNLLLLVYDAVRKTQDSNGIQRENDRRTRFLREVFSNISFAILVAIGAIIAVLISILMKGCVVAEFVSSAFTYFLVALFLLTLLMLLKRVHILVFHDITNR